MNRKRKKNGIPNASAMSVMASDPASRSRLSPHRFTGAPPP
ncbi:MAG: hypothetical protein WBJ51_05030 [Methanoculleus sp.]|nr:hypothetical protein [Methanoculleus sp.]HPZ32913.1 hypothetical protein [Methanoculleus sp.]HQD24395.1 hypothetical protein [Methanoculleus sp.]HRD26027.1 hypothetical protein [Methanoculleus sp.]